MTLNITNTFFLLSLWFALPLLEGLETTQGLGVYTKKKLTVISFTTEAFQTTSCPCSPSPGLLDQLLCAISLSCRCYLIYNLLKG